MNQLEIDLYMSKINSRLNILENFFNKISFDIISIETNFQEVTGYCINIVDLLKTIRNDIDNADSKILIHEDTIKQINKLKSELIIKQHSMKKILTSVKAAMSV